MKSFLIKLLIIIYGFTLYSCQPNKDESTLTTNDILYIQSLGVLNENEDIELLESNGGFKGIKQSGNFITRNRIVSYWIEDNQKDIESANFSNEIDSITFTDLTSNLTYSSYLTVYKTDGKNFKVYVDADSIRSYQFYNKAVDNLTKYRNEN